MVQQLEMAENPDGEDPEFYFVRINTSKNALVHAGEGRD